MPTSASSTYQDIKLQPSRHPEIALEERFQMTISTTFAKGQCVAIVTATGKLGIYADAGAGGLGVMKGICPYACVSDGSGNITIEGGNILGTTEDTIPIFISGYFLTADLTGADAAGVADMGGHLVWGDYTTGEIRLP